MLYIQQLIKILWNKNLITTTSMYFMQWQFAVNSLQVGDIWKYLLWIIPSCFGKVCVSSARCSFCSGPGCTCHNRWGDSPDPRQSTLHNTTEAHCCTSSQNITTTCTYNTSVNTHLWTDGKCVSIPVCEMRRTAPAQFHKVNGWLPQSDLKNRVFVASVHNKKLLFTVCSCVAQSYFEYCL